MREKQVLILLTVLGIIGLGICKDDELNSNESEAKLFAKQSSDKIFDFFDESVNVIVTKNYDNFNLDEYFLNASTLFLDVAETAKKFNSKNFKDNDLKYFFESIRENIGIAAIGGERFYQLFLRFNDLEIQFKEANVTEYHNRDNLITYVPDVENIIKSSSDPDELQFYWTKSRELSGHWAEENFLEIIRCIQDASNFSDMSAVDFWLEKKNITEIEKLMDEIKPLYVQLHAFIRSRLNKKYGDSIIKSEDELIPDHLFEQVLKQAWSNESLIEDIFPIDTLPPVESVMKRRFKALELYEMADNFYGYLGFEKFPYSYWNDRIKMAETEDGDECKPIAFYNTPNVYLEYCEKMNFMDFLDAYVQMGKLYYAKEMTGLPAYFFQMDGLDEAIGKAVVLSVSTHHNLKAVGMIVDFNITQEVEMNRLMRKAIQSILQIPIDFVHTKLMVDTLSSGNMDLKKINEHYWHLLKKYAGIGPPKNYKSDILDMSREFFEQLDESQERKISKFNMEILSYQIYKKLCQLSGKYAKGSLHLCDIHRSKDAGNALKKMMQLGTSKPFEKVLETMFVENPKIMSEALLEYYKPIMDLLVEKNKGENVKTGWKTSGKI